MIPSIGRTKVRSSIRMASKKSSGHVVGLIGSKITAFPLGERKPSKSPSELLLPDLLLGQGSFQ